MLWIALAATAAGVVAFLAYLGFVCGECDDHPFGMLDWVVGGVLIGPGFGLLIKWRAARGA